MSEPLAIPAVRRTVRELVDGTLRVQIDIEPMHRADFWKLFPEIDAPVALAPLAIQGGEAQETYRQEAKALFLSGFFLDVDVLRAIGSDEDYQNWVRQSKCLVCKGVPAEYAHVRIADDRESGGVALKPAYRGVPLCHAHHELQHQKGYVALFNAAHPTQPVSEDALGLQEAKNWLYSSATAYARKWAREVLREHLGYESWTEVPPSVLLAWAGERGLQHKLPMEYRKRG